MPFSSDRVVAGEVAAKDRQMRLPVALGTNRLHASKAAVDFDVLLDLERVGLQVTGGVHALGHPDLGTQRLGECILQVEVGGVPAGTVMPRPGRVLPDAADRPDGVRLVGSRQRGQHQGDQD